MKSCPVCSCQLQPVLTHQGVEVEYCVQCQGVWLDRDEIYHFTKMPVYLKAKLDEALKHAKPSPRRSPSDYEMVELSLWQGDVTVDYCPTTGGMWLDKDEIRKFPMGEIRMQIDEGTLPPDTISGEKSESPERESAPSTGPVDLLPLPNLALSSASVIVGLYAIMSFLLISASLYLGLSAGFALVIALVFVTLQFLIGPFIMDLMLNWLYHMHWVRPQDLPPRLRMFVERVCREHDIKFPKFGIIEDSAPQAFTYGHTPNNGRIVISRGILELLTEEEAETVVAHEIGHMVHWDMFLMTVAQLVPLVLYYLYRTLIRVRSNGKDNSAGPRMVIAIGAYVLYIISEYVVLWFSRLREYHADRFAGQVTRAPNTLASALVKIGYGLAGTKSAQDKEGNERAAALKGTQAMNIFSIKHANLLALASGGTGRMGGSVDKAALREAARWDLWNPWAAYYELHSTHPLIAKRIRALGNQAQSLGQAVYVNLDERKPESYWDHFFMDVVVHLLPAIVALGGFLWIGGRLFASVFSGEAFSHMTNPLGMFEIGVFLTALGLAFLLKVLYAYSGGEFKPMNVRGLLKKVVVSAVDPVPCRISGTIIGRGVPGLLYSEDFVLQDDTGIIFLDYEQPIAIVNFLFGLLRAQKYINQPVEVVGWYRRAPVPYIEIRKLIINGRTSVCYVYHIKLVLAVLWIMIGLALGISGL